MISRDGISPNHRITSHLPQAVVPIFTWQEIWVGILIFGLVYKYAYQYLLMCKLYISFEGGEQTDARI